MDKRTIETSLDELKKCHAETAQKLSWSSPFILPEWLEVWWRVFGSDFKPYISEIFIADEIIGVAPLMVKNGTAYFLGGTDVCDYQDFIIAAGRENNFFDIFYNDM